MLKFNPFVKDVKNVVLVLVLAANVYPLTKEYIISKLKEAGKEVPPAYEAKVTSAAYVEGMVVKDSGTVIFSPPSCFQVNLLVSKNETSTCGDTSWLRTADGNIEVTVNKNMTERMGNPGFSGL